MQLLNTTVMYNVFLA